MKKILTIIFDGFGIREEEKGNAVKLAKMPAFNHMWDTYPHTTLFASEERVGLNEGQVGNSEVGHMTIGAGRLIKQNEIRVNDFLSTDYQTNEKFNDLLNKKDKNIHLMGLCSDGNVHAGIDDFISMYHLLIKNGFKNIYFDLITDGRDTDVHSSSKYIKTISEEIKKYHVGKIATLCGRYYAMDRDNNYDRIEKYYNLVVKGIGISSIYPIKTIDNFYEKGITDEFIKPIILEGNNHLKDDDILIWLNYRADRSKEILRAIINSDFKEFNKINLKLDVYSFFPIDKEIKTINFLEPTVVNNSLGLYFADLEITQARIAESEKYPHVTYFFDGGISTKIPLCDKYEIPSPSVATYDLKPEMSCELVTKRVISSMEKDYDFILVNFANPDMVGHTGNLEATIKACETIDGCLTKLVEVADDNFYKIILLADHGNADTMINEDGSICTTHTTSKVPFIIRDLKVQLRENGDLTNVAPTILTYMDIALPKEMQATTTLFKE